MRSRFLMSAAIFVAGLAVASAQTAPGGVQQRNQIRNGGSNDVRSQARGHGHRAAAPAFGAVDPGPDNRGRNQGTRDGTTYPRGRALLSPAKHNDASVMAPRGPSGRDGLASDRSILDRAMAQGRLQSQRDRRDGIASDRSILDRAMAQGRLQSTRGRHDGIASDRSILDRAMVQGRPRPQRDRHDGIASDRSILDRAMAQGRLRSQTNRTGQDDEHRSHEHKVSQHNAYDRGGLDHPARAGHRQIASKGHAPHDLARTTTPRRLPDQGMGSASARDLGEARGQGGERELGQARGQAGVKIKRQARNHHREQARGQARSLPRGEAHGAALRPDSQQGRDEIRKVQAALNQQGFNVGDPDGKLGKRTKEALIAFQKQHGFRTTGKPDHATLDALLANGAAPATSPQNSQPDPAHPAQAVPDQAAPQAIPPAIPPQPGTTGQGDAQPAMPPTEPAPESPQMPDNAGSGRIPSGSPQENYKEDTVPGGDQR
jgi:hypothetical protein